jgi:hypothetical protein
MIIVKEIRLVGLGPRLDELVSSAGDRLVLIYPSIQHLVSSHD